MPKSQKRRTSGPRGKPGAYSARQTAPDDAKRATLRWLRNGALGTVALGAGGYFAAESFKAHAAEHDLSRVGAGKPTVVQVHDPQCPTCTALQKQARRALKQFGECDLVYLVADIKTTEGQAFAARYGVPHVTLLLFDAEGGLQDTQHGMQASDALGEVFRQHHSTFGMGT